MGCCISTKSSETAQNPKANKQISFNNGRFSKSPPQPEEETVKEIVHLSQPQENLSAAIITSSPFIKSAPLLLEKPFIKAPPRFPKNTDRNGVASAEKKPFTTQVPSGDVPEEISSTVSETVSEKREEAASSSKPGRREALFKGRQRTMSKSPGRRTDPSPNRFRQSPGRGRDNITSREFSDRRSKSPVTRVDSNRTLKTNTGRINPPRRSVRSPNRAGPGPAWVPPESVLGDESLENPLVSMECFIFL